MKFIPNTWTRAVGRSVLTAKTHSPTLLFVGGVAAMGATVFLACRATLRVETVLEETNLNLEEARQLRADGKYVDENDYAKDIAYSYVDAAARLTKLYGPAILTGVASVAMLTQSHRILTNRNAALTAAYTTLDAAFTQYRRRVVSELGEEKDLEFRHGKNSRTIVEETDKGPKKTQMDTFNPNELSGYAVIFERGCKMWQPSIAVNRSFLECVEDFSNKKLDQQGWVLLNDVYKALGFPETTAGAIVGWTRDGGDKRISFGLHPGRERAHAFLQGVDNSVILDFNVEGPIYRKIDKYREEK